MNERKRLIELLYNIPPMNINIGGRRNGKRLMTMQHLADHLLANGVIVPPCKVGQTVFCIRYDKARKPFVKPLEICSIASFGAGKFMVFTTKLDTWGVTAFATREEAEKALAERGKR